MSEGLDVSGEFPALEIAQDVVTVIDGLNVSQGCVEEGFQVIFVTGGNYRLHNLVKIQIGEDFRSFPPIDSSIDLGFGE